MSGDRTRSALGALALPLRRRLAAAAVAAWLGAGLVVLGSVGWLARLGVVGGFAWVLWAWVVVLGLAGAAAVWARWNARRLSATRLGRRLEESGRFRAGAIRLLLEPLGAGTSGRLLEAADASQAVRLASDGPAVLEPDRRRLERLGGVGVALVLVGLILTGALRPSPGAASAIWRPDLAWAALVSPIRLTASASRVTRGDSVWLAIEAPGRTEALLWTRRPGETWSARPVVLDRHGRGREVIGPLLGDLHARLTAGGRASDTISVTVRLPMFVAQVEATAEYPGYLDRDPEALPLDGDTVAVPAGTRIQVRGRASALLAGAVWRGDRDTVAMTVSEDRFEGRILPAVDGEWVLALQGRPGEPLEPTGTRLALRIVPDLAPIVEVPVPGQDTLETTTGAVGLLVDVRDDHAVRRVELETHRPGQAPRRQELPLPDGAVARALLNVSLDLVVLGIGPGDTLVYRLTAVDNAPTPQRSVSREFVVIVPTLTDLREAQREATADAAARSGELAARGRELARATEDLARARPRGPEGRPASSEPMGFDEARRAQEAARAQEQLTADVEALDDALQELQRAAESAGIEDSAFARRLEEIRQELQRALSPELRERLAALQEALQRLDAPAAREALQQLADAQREMREALERSRELFERAAMEGELGSLSQEASELAAEQRAWSDSVMTAEGARAASAERALAERADSVAAAMERTAGRLEDPGARQEMEQAAELTRAAADQMRQAAQSAQQGQRRQAGQQGQQAAGQMQQAQQQVDASRAEQQEAWRQEVMDALDQTLLEATRLTARQLAVAQQFRRSQSATTLRQEQASIEEGVRQLLDQVTAAGGRNALVPPQIAGALAAARQQMALARDAIATASLNLREGGDRAGEAVDALNVAAFLLLRARSEVAGSSSGSGMAEAMERMADMAQQQGSIGQDASALLPMMGSPGADRQVQQLAERQRQLGQELDRLRAETTSPAAAEFAEEARELARELEAGRLDPATIARQERLFRRMLDAGRTLQGEEEDDRKERESRSATDAEILLPPAVRARLLDARGLARMPQWEALQRLTPEERRLVTDYFRRLARGTEGPP